MLVWSPGPAEGSAFPVGAVLTAGPPAAVVGTEGRFHFVGAHLLLKRMDQLVKESVHRRLFVGAQAFQKRL